LTYHTANFHGAGGIGLCLLALAPFGIVAMRRNTFARSVVLLALLLTCTWFFTQQESRFLIPIYWGGRFFGGGMELYFSALWQAAAPNGRRRGWHFGSV
jgi:hypothetical protein